MSLLSYTSPQFWEWVESHKGYDATQLRLASHKESDIDIPAAITQVDCRRRFGKKLAETLREFPHFYFPDTLSGEQATSDLLATFHKHFVQPDDNLVDLTAGLGIDLLHLARKVRQATAIERQKDLCQALEYNAKGLGISNLDVVNGDCSNIEVSGTVAFIDPARRAHDGHRVFGFSECEPDLLSLLPKLRNNFTRLIVKASPMLDISRTISDLAPHVTDIYVLGTTTECKELIVLMDFNNTARKSEPTIHAVTINANGSSIQYSFTRSEEAEAQPIKSSCQAVRGDIIYLPYPATMKAAPVKLLSSTFSLMKFHINTHLYYGTSSSIRWDFPGEKLEIIEIIPWQSKNLKRLKNKYPNVSVSVRNFGMTAEALRNKLGVREGGKDNLRLFGIGLGGDAHTDRLLVVGRPLLNPNNS